MVTANANILRDTVRLALQSSGVAAAAAVDPTAWAADPDAGGHVFDGDGGLHRGRSRGRLPFLEFWLTSQEAHQLAYDGGVLDSELTVRAHVGGRDQASNEELAQEMIFAAVAAIRDLPEGRYAFLGDEHLDSFKVGPWGHMLDVHVTIKQVYGRTDVANPPVVIQRGNPAPGLDGEDSTFVGQNIDSTNLVPGMVVARLSSGVRRAWAEDNTLNAVALAGALVAPGESGDMVTDGVVSQADWSLVTESGAAALTVGVYYLSTVPGKITPTPPVGAGRIVQMVGTAVSGTEFDIEIDEPVVLS